jgi:hypothetical protein
MAVTFRGASSSVAWTATGGAVAPAIPAGQAAGDLLIYLATASIGVSAVTTPAGYSQYVSRSSGAFSVGAKIAIASESAPSISWTGSVSDDGGVLVDFAGVSVTQFDNLANTEASSGVSSSTGIAYPALTPVSANCGIILLAFVSGGFTIGTPTTGSWTSAFTASASPNSGYAICGFQNIQSGITAISAGSIGLTGASTGQVSFAFIASIAAAPLPSSSNAMLLGVG